MGRGSWWRCGHWPQNGRTGRNLATLATLDADRACFLFGTLIVFVSLLKHETCAYKNQNKPTTQDDNGTFRATVNATSRDGTFARRNHKTCIVLTVEDNFLMIDDLMYMYSFLPFDY